MSRQPPHTGFADVIMLLRNFSKLFSTPYAARFASATAASKLTGTKITAAVCTGPKQPFVLEELFLDDPRDGEVLIKVHACGICHTDLAVRDQHIPSPAPIVLGHEGVGIVEKVGKGVTKVKRGDAVVLSYAACGQCNNCQSGSPSYCSSHRLVNFSGARLDGSTTLTSATRPTVHGAFFRQSAFATHALATERNVIPVPSELGLKLESLAPLGCGVQTGAGAVMNTLKCGAGSSIAVFGVGSVGLSSILAARVVGCGNIIAVDASLERLEIAKSLGATHTVLSKRDSDPKEVASAIAQVVKHQGGLDYSIDTTGVPSVLRLGVEGLRATGVAALVGGSPPGSELKVDMLTILLGRTVRGIIQGDSVSSAFLPKLMRLHQAGRFPFDKLITYYGSLGDINKAVADVTAGTVVKPVIRIE